MPKGVRLAMRKSLSLLMNRRFLARYYDPYRILINQIIRLFSGSLPRKLQGSAIRMIFGFSFFNSPSISLSSSIPSSSAKSKRKSPATSFWSCLGLMAWTWLPSCRAVYEYQQCLYKIQQLLA